MHSRPVGIINVKKKKVCLVFFLLWVSDGVMNPERLDRAVVITDFIKFYYCYNTIKYFL